MKTNYVLVDFENVQPENLDLVKGDQFRVKVFVGPNQKIPVSVAKALQAFGTNAEYIAMEKSGQNALDFHIAYYLGRLVMEAPDAFFHIISKDTGFDPLVLHLKGQKISARRCVGIEDIPLVKIQEISGQLEACIELLKKGHQSRTEKALRNRIRTHLGGQACDDQVSWIIKELQKKKVLSIEDGKVCYGLSS